jgi:putative cardiolipin synthase
METLDPDGVNDVALARLRRVLAARAAEVADSCYAHLLRGSDLARRLAAEWLMQWADEWKFVADDPAKVTMKKRDIGRTHVGVALWPMLQEAREEIIVVSPYFVPGEEVTARLTRAAASGKVVRVLTNSLVANDVAAVHGGYSRFRKPLLKGGVNASVFGSSGASLHTKSFVVDARASFVGSYNFDPHSTWLNCEQDVLVEDATLAVQLAALFEQQSGPRHAWQVTLDEGRLAWSDGRETHARDPEATAWQRFQAWITKVLRLDAQL